MFETQLDARLKKTRPEKNAITQDASKSTQVGFWNPFKALSRAHVSNHKARDTTTDWEIQKSHKSNTITATQRNLNVLSLQNASLTLALSDILGLSHLLALHVLVLNTLPIRPINLRAVFILWEMVMVSVVVYSVVRWMWMGERVVGVGVRVMEEGVGMGEWIAHGIRRGIERLVYRF